MQIETTLVVLALCVYSIVREILHYKQTTRLQELLKANDVTEYYEAVRGKTPKRPPADNQIMDEEPNQISIDSPDFDITKATKVIKDGQEQDIEIFS